MSGCKSVEPCKPGTVLLRATVEEAAADADSLEVIVKRSGQNDFPLGPFPWRSGSRQESIEVQFAKYTPNLEVTFQLTLKKQNLLVGSGEKKVTLLSGCSSGEVAISTILPPQPDLAGADLYGLDFAGLDLTPLPDLTPIDLAGVDFYGVDFSVPQDMAVSGNVPGAPTTVTATANAGGTISLSWAAPLNTGSTPLEGFSIESVPPGLSTTVAVLSYTTPALALGTSYTFNVKAYNSIGSGPAGVSNAVVAGDKPAAPANVAATVPSGRLVATWDAAQDYGYPVTGYTMTANPGGKTTSVPGNVLTATLTGPGLNSGTQYTVTVTATNQFGTGMGGVSNTATFNCAAHTYPNQEAADSATVNYGSGMQTTPTPSLFAARSDSADQYGWAKFSMSNVKSWAVITALTLSVKVQDTFGTPTPVHQVYYSATDSWFLNMNDPDGAGPLLPKGPQPADVTRGVVVSSTFGPAAINTYQSIGISLANHDFQTDLADGNVTLGISNTVVTSPGGTSYTQWFAANASAGNRPQLIVTTCE